MSHTIESSPLQRIVYFDYCLKMYYKVTVFTSNSIIATTYNYVYIKLVGTEGESNRTWLLNLKGPFAFVRGTASTFYVNCPESLGKLVLIEVDKQPILRIIRDSWYPARVEVESPEGETYCFPIHQLITDSEVHRFREGKALTVANDDHYLGEYARQQELSDRKSNYCWTKYEEGLPHCIKADGPFSLPDEIQFSSTKLLETSFTALTGQLKLGLTGLDGCQEPWRDIKAFEAILCEQTKITEYVQKHWREDAVFGYQYLNGLNPILIKVCKDLPENFPVTDDMVNLGGQGCLKEEMERGNIFLCDYKNLDGLEGNIINDKQQYMTAPLVLLHSRQEELLPIAIQLKQKPGDDNPIFLPSDSDYDWLLAKIFVRSADFQEHELNVHLLRTHLLAEVFAVSLLRNVPMVHPLFKLLIPHTRYTLQINQLARTLLISKTGVFTQYAASGGKAMLNLLTRSLSSMTYSSLCLPDDIAERGVGKIPNYYYRDDGLELWETIFKFVKGILGYYYKTDDEVQKDPELQKWIKDIFVYGFLSQKQTGIPQEFTTVEEMVKFVTMVIFTCSCQHSAVNSGQYDYGAFMPNTPISLQLPPPTKKNLATEALMMQTLPDINVTAQGMAVLYLLSQESTDFVELGCYPETHFTEKVPLEMINIFQAKLNLKSARIQARNVPLEIPYTFMDPPKLENSVAL